jgi:hypothetical protein
MSSFPAEFSRLSGGDPPLPSCSLLFSAPTIEEFQQLAPDPLLPRARRSGRFAKGSSGNPRGDRAALPTRNSGLPDLVA